MELVIFARIHAYEGQEDAVAALLDDEARASRADPGCLSHAAYRSLREPQLFYIHSRWKDDASFEAHVETPHTVHFVERIEPLLDHPLDVTRARALA